jgi:hypothetical protein
MKRQETKRNETAEEVLGKRRKDGWLSRRSYLYYDKYINDNEMQEKRTGIELNYTKNMNKYESRNRLQHFMRCFSTYCRGDCREKRGNKIHMK